MALPQRPTRSAGRARLARLTSPTWPIRARCTARSAEVRPRVAVGDAPARPGDADACDPRMDENPVIPLPEGDIHASSRSGNRGLLLGERFPGPCEEWLP